MTMESNKIITHVELPVNPEFAKEVLFSANQTKDLILLEDGTEVFVLTQKVEDPDTLVILAIYTSRELYEWHLEQVYVKSFFSFLGGKLLGAPKVTYLKEVGI